MAVLAVVLGLLAAPLAAEAQPAGKMYRIGSLSLGAGINHYIDAFRHRLRDLGYREGENRACDPRRLPLRDPPVRQGLHGYHVAVTARAGMTPVGREEEGTVMEESLERSDQPYDAARTGSFPTPASSWRRPLPLPWDYGWPIAARAIHQHPRTSAPAASAKSH